MFKNYLIISWRTIKGNILSSFISIIGLAIGMACCIIIMLFVKHELSYDRFHENASRIYRMIDRTTLFGKDTTWPQINLLIGPAMKEELPEVEAISRIIEHNGFVIEYSGKRLTINPVYADPPLFKIFSFPFIIGDKQTAFNNPDSVVISESLTKKIFGQDLPINKIITMYAQNQKYDLRVSGIIKDMPSNSQIRFDFIVSFRHLENRWKQNDTDPSYEIGATYLLLADNSIPTNIERKLPALISKYLGKQYATNHIYSLQSLTAVHLHSNFFLDSANTSKISLSFYLSAIALLILLIAGINSIILSTARCTRRAREVGLRKVVGAKPFQIFLQFLGESLFIAFLALFVAIIISFLLLSFLNSLLGQNIPLEFMGNLDFFVWLILLALIVGFLSGSYPALLLSSLGPAEILKRSFKIGSRSGLFLRKGLIVFQFAISLVFIIVTFLMLHQLRYIHTKDLGFNKDNVISISIVKDKSLINKADLFVRECQQNPNILQAISTYGLPPGTISGFPVPCIPEGFPTDSPIEMSINQVGEDYFNFFGIPIINGRDFSINISSDAETAIIINETAGKLLGWKDAIGKEIRGPELERYFRRKGSAIVIGVVKDFYNGSLHDNIKPSIFKFEPKRNSIIFLRIRAGYIRDTIDFLEKKWNQQPTFLPFSYAFLDTTIQGSYKNDQNTMKIFSFFAILAVTLACLGLFGLALFEAERRRKETGIRKVLGANVLKIVLLLSKDFMQLVLLSNIIAWPLAYYIGHRWLANFYNRVGVNLWTFIFATMLTIIMAFWAISYQTVKAATKNPADILRME